MGTEEIILIAAVAAVAALIKSVAGFGYPVLLVPVLSLFIDFVDAVLIVAPSNFLLNLGMVWSLRDHRHDALTLRTFCSFGVAGAIAGTLLLPWIPVDAARVILFVLLVAFLVNRVSPLRVSLSDTSARRYAPLVGAVSGVFQGATGIAGPVVTPWFLSLDRGRQVFVFSITTVFGITGLAQIAVALLDGIFERSTIGVAMLLIPVSILAIPVGARIRERVSVETFEKFVLSLLTLSSLTLLARILGLT